MVGRLLRCLPVLCIACLAAARPAAAQPRRLFLEPLQLTALSSAAPAQPSAAAGGVAAATAEAAALADVADPSELADPSEPAPAFDRQPAAATAAAPAAARAGLPGAAAPVVLLDSGEYGVEYQLSLRDAQSFLGRLASRFKGLVEQAMSYLGTPYRRGGNSRRGVDCSGLVGVVYAQQGLEMPRTAAEQFAEGVAVGDGDLRPGDLVFFRDTYKRGISHVGIYVGDGRFIHAAGHRRGVILSELSRAYYQSRYAGARRVGAEPAVSDPEAASPAGAATTSTAIPTSTGAASMLAGPR